MLLVGSKWAGATGNAAGQCSCNATTQGKAAVHNYWCRMGKGIFHAAGCHAAFVTLLTIYRGVWLLRCLLLLHAVYRSRLAPNLQQPLRSRPNMLLSCT
jgi:hypothetical protein